MALRGCRLVIAAAGMFALAFASACSHQAGLVSPQVPSTLLDETGSESVDARDLAAQAPFTVFVFFAPDCHCLTQHEPRLFALYETFRPRGVNFFMVDSEIRGSIERDATESRKRGYPFPILLDRGAKLANALGAEYATYVIIVEQSGRVRYHGGLDSDKQHMHDDATFFVKDALDDLLAGREPRLVVGKALGCALQKW